MRFNKIALYFSLFTFHFSLIVAQEHLMPMKTNPVLVNFTKEAKRTHSAAWRIISDSIVVKLPFLDDFSRPGPYPYDSLWMDNAAFVNLTYPICPYTLGVATLDGVNSEGQPYDPGCAPGTSLPADSLTSRPIDLSPYTVSDSVWLSFYYQAGGRSPSPPMHNDTLLLQFRTSKIPWTTIWYMNGYTPGATDTNFHLVMIPLRNSQYFDPNFQFRFKNYACTSANVDQWNIDQVYMDRHRIFNDSLSHQDVSFVYECPSLLAKYQYMPWEQFTQNDIRDTMFLYMRYNGNVLGGVNAHDSSFNDAPPASKYLGGFANILPFYIYGYNKNYTQTHIPIKSYYNYTPLTSPTVTRETNVLYSTYNFINWNDTVRFDQVFSDFYAYDDGTAEAAYFINGTTPLSLAYQFTLNYPDTLRGLFVYFDYMFVNPANYNMRLAVWDNTGTGGTPGNLTFEDDTIVSPKFSDSLNGFVFYPYHAPNPLAESGTIYVGWIQTFGDSLDIGYDLNTDHHDKIYFNDNSCCPYGWQQGTYPGSMMMRPVFGNQKVLASPEMKNDYKTLTLYPNPASNSVNLSSVLPPNSILKIYSPEGKEFLNDDNFHGHTINTSSLPAGFYIVEITSKGQNPLYQKLVIER